MNFHAQSAQIDDLGIHLKIFEPDQQLTWRRHVPARLCVLLSGGMSEAMAFRGVDYAPSDVIYKPPEEHPRLNFGPAGAITLTLELGPSRLEQLREAGVLVDRAFSDRSPRCAGLGMRIYHELRDRDALSPLVLEGLTLELLAEAWRPVRNGRRTRPPRWLEQVRHRIHDEFDQRGRGLVDYARGAGVHPIHLAQSFRAHYGASMGEYTRRVRIHFASRQLIETATPLAEIAHAAGYYDQGHFSRAFKRATDLTPGEYRRFFAPSRLQKD